MSEERLRRAELVRDSGLYLVTEEAFSAGRSSEEIAEVALAAGVRVIQVREKEGSVRRALQIARNLREATRRYGALLLIDDRVDLALAVDADGVHVGQDDMPVAEARRLLGPDALIGLSITEAGQLDSADSRAADYLGVGAIFPTGTKGDATLTGLDVVRASTRIGSPVVAIGGIAAANAAQAIRAGADSVAVVTAITQADDPGAATAELLRVVSGALGSAAGATTRPRP